LELLKRPVDLVVSGINLGSNAGVNVLYSGTVAAAIEAVMLGIPGIAISLDFCERPDFAPAARIARMVVGRIAKRGLRKDMLLNVNVPALPSRRIKGIRVTRQSRSMPAEGFEPRTDPMGRHYYWIKPWGASPEDEEDADACALKKGYVTITPLQYDLTSQALLDELRAWEWPGRVRGC
jgi:5'-nucleotidase